jgi:transposase
MAYSQDIRSRVTQAVSHGLSRRAAAGRFAVSASSAIRWAARAAQEGTAARHKPGRPPGKGRLSDHLTFLAAAVEATPDITMPELAARLLAERGVTAHPASLSRLLCRARVTYKKTTDGRRMYARGRRRATAAVARAASAPHAPRARTLGLPR